MGLVMLQPDLGTAMVLGGDRGLRADDLGVRKRWIAVLTLVGGGRGGRVWFLELLEPYQVARFTAFLDPSVDPRGVGYNSTQSLIAIGSGELFGKGLFGGGQTTGRFVPEQHTDFIFTVAGEEFGFLGAATVVLLLGVVLLRGLKIARQCEDRFGTLVAGHDRVLVRVPDVRQHGDDDRHHADHRPAAAVRLLRWHRHVREPDRGGVAAGASGCASSSRTPRRGGRVPAMSRAPASVGRMPVESIFPRLEALLPKVQKPIQYVGGELNSTVKDWDDGRRAMGADVSGRLRGGAAQPGCRRSSTRSSTSCRPRWPSAPTPSGPTLRR